MITIIDFAKETRFHEELRFSVNCKFDDGISVHITRSSTSYSHGHVSSRTPPQCELFINQDKTDTTEWFQIYKGRFGSGSKAYDYLNDYVRSIAEPFLERNRQQKGNQENQEPSIKNKFWNE